MADEAVETATGTALHPTNYLFVPGNVLEGLPFADGGRVGDYLQAAQLARVTVRTIPMPCGDAGGRIAKMLAVDWVSVLNALGGMMVARGIASAERLDAVFAAARAELAAPDNRSVMPTYIAFGRKAHRA